MNRRDLTLSETLRFGDLEDADADIHFSPRTFAGSTRRHTLSFSLIVTFLEARIMKITKSFIHFDNWYVHILLFLSIQEG